MRGIYSIKNITNNKEYIGKSVNIEERIKTHKRELKRGHHHNSHLQRSYNKYGEECFEYSILYEAREDEDLDFLEMKFIEERESYTNGYNSTKGGGGDLGLIITDEFREKMKQLVMGEKNPNYGHKWTPEMKSHLSQLFSDGSRKGGNNARAVKVIRVEDCKVFETQGEAAHDIGLSSGSSITLCLDKRSRVANNYHFIEFSEENLSFLEKEENRFSYLCQCYTEADKPFIADMTNHKFYKKYEFINFINKTEHIPKRKIESILCESKNFIIGKIEYQLLVA